MKLFVTDYDDTLYLNDDGIKKNITKLKELKKHNFIILISTGRSILSIKEQIDKYQIPYDYLSCADGSIIYDNKGKIILKFKLNKNIIDTFKSFYQTLNYEEIQFSYPEGYSNILKENDNLLGINVCLSTKNYTDKIVKDFYKLKEKYPNYNYLAYKHSNYSYLCIKPKNVSKAYAINELRNLLKIKKEDIYVIGDSSNDVEMIQEFNGVAMKNSCIEVLNITKHIYNEVSDYIDDILKNILPNK